jgi:hypothetical protein
MSKLPIAKINRKDFIEWLYSDKHELRELADEVISSIQDSGSYSVDIDDLYGGLGGFYAEDMVQNYKELKTYIESCEGYDDGWLDNPSAFMKVKWT